MWLTVATRVQYLSSVCMVLGSTTGVLNCFVNIHLVPTNGDTTQRRTVFDIVYFNTHWIKECCLVLEHQQKEKEGEQHLKQINACE